MNDKVDVLYEVHNLPKSSIKNRNMGSSTTTCQQLASALATYACAWLKGGSRRQTLDRQHHKNPKGPSTRIVGFQGPKTIQSMDFGALLVGYLWVLGPSGEDVTGTTEGHTQVQKLQLKVQH